MKRLCTICARGGSKGVANKNIRPLLDKPLLAFSIEQAQKSMLFDVIAISSDSDEILDCATKYGVDLIVQRPTELATDTAAKLPVIRHCLEASENMTGFSFDQIVDLDATSPLRFIEDIHEVVNLLENDQIFNVITGCPARRSPYFNVVELNENGSPELSKQSNAPVVRRQDAPACYDMNASIYGWRRHTLVEQETLFCETTALHVMPEDRSVDIDTEIDFAIVEMIMRQRSKK